MALLKKKYLLLIFFLMILNLILVFLHKNEEGAFGFTILLVVIGSYKTLQVLKCKQDNKIQQITDSTSFFLFFLLLWNFFIQHCQIGDPVLYPSPMKIASIMIEEFPRFIDNLQFSLVLLSVSFIFAFALAFPLGILLSLNHRIQNIADPYVKIISLISPIAYLPYAIGLMPNFWLASVFVVFNGMFWPILKWTIYGVTTVDSNYIFTSESLGLSSFQYFHKVLIPAIMPSVLSGIGGSISGGFGVLIAAEMLGSSRGLGFFIKYFSNFLNYPKVLVGIIYLGLSVCIVMKLYEKLQKKILSWQTKERKEEQHEIFWKIFSFK